MIDFNSIILSDKKDDSEYNFNGNKFYSSSFNTVWFNELGIEPKIILDIGSYDFGDSIRYKLEFPNSSVYGFEADRSRYEKTYKYAESCEVEVYNKAMYRESGFIDFFPAKCLIKDAGSFHNPGDFGGQGSIYKHNEKYTKRFSHIKQLMEPKRVECICLKDFCEEKNITDITFAQIDVEGAELDVLIGFGDLRPKLLFIEIQDDLFENNSKKEDVYNLLEEMGYHLLKYFNVDKLYIYKN